MSHSSNRHAPPPPVPQQEWINQQQQPQPPHQPYAQGPNQQYSQGNHQQYIKAPPHPPWPAQKVSQHDQNTVSWSPQPQAPQKTVKVLLLTFRYHDLDGGRGEIPLDDEAKHVKRAFESLWGQGVVTEKTIQMNNTTNVLIEDLRGFFPTAGEAHRHGLYVVYYHGHGYRNSQGRFALGSHNYPSPEELAQKGLPGPGEFWNFVKKYALSDTLLGRDHWTQIEKIFPHLQPRAEVAWEDINQHIMRANCDTLVILDCCNAGLAAITDIMLNQNLDAEVMRGCPDPSSPYRKELLAACSWSNNTWDRMSPSLCKVLTEAEDLWKDAGGQRRHISVSTLVRLMNNELAREHRVLCGGRLDEVPQAVHYVLRRSKRRPITLEKLVPAGNDTGPLDPHPVPAS